MHFDISNLKKKKKLVLNTYKHTLMMENKIVTP